MGLHGTARAENIRKTLEKYVQDNLESGGAETLPVAFPPRNIWWEDLAFDTSKVSFFLRPRVINERGQSVASVAPTGERGYFKHWTLALDVFIKRDYVRESQDRNVMVKTLDAIGTQFIGTTGIAVYDYHSTGIVEQGKLWVRDRIPNKPRDDQWITGGWMIRLQWAEQDKGE